MARRHSPDSPSPPGPTALIALACWAPLAAGAEPFIGQFELKTLESAPGDYEFQSQNAWSWGQPSRRIVLDDDGFEMDENSVVRQRHALELEIGLTHSLKTRFGIEFEKERLDEPATLEEANAYGSLKLAEVGAEIIAILVPRESDGFGLSVVAEIEAPVDREESNRLILGPILEFRAGPWFAAAIPMAVHAFGGEAEEGERVDNKWDFAYASQLKYTFSERWALALESYGTVERLGNTGRPSESAQRFGDFDQHRAGPVLYYTYTFDRARRVAHQTPGPHLLSATEKEEEGTSVSFGVGLLEGLNAHAPDHTLKFSIEIQF